MEVAMTLLRYNPAREFYNTEREFSKFFNSIGEMLSRNSDQDSESSLSNWMPLTDITEDKNHYQLHIDLPGIKKEDVKISFNNGRLSISGERKSEVESKDTQSHRIERAYGKFYRSFNLPELIIEDKIEAEFVDGQLKISIPKAEEAKPKEIEIKVK